MVWEEKKTDGLRTRRVMTHGMKEGKWLLV